MTDRGIWDKEGEHPVPPAERSGAGGSIWRPDEGRAEEAPAPGKDTAAPAIWREDEGAIATITRTPPRPQTTDGPVARDEADADGDGAAPRRRRARHRPRHRAKPFPWGRAAILTIIFLVLLVAADAVYTGLRLAEELEGARADLTDARGAVDGGRLADANAAVEGAREHARAAGKLVERPSVKVAARLPGIEREADAAIALAVVAENATRAGKLVITGLRDIGITEEGIASSIYEDGKVGINQIVKVHPRFTEAADLFGLAERVLEQTEAPRLGALRRAVNDARDEISDAAATTARADALFSILPQAMGGSEQRRYLLAFQALGEARALGGVIGQQGILAANDGRLSLESVGPPLRQLTSPGPRVDAPGWFRRAYEFQGALSQWQQANVSPNLPAVAEVLLEMHERATGDELDGVFFMDPVGLATLMEGLEPIRGEGIDVEIDAGNAVEVLALEGYALDEPAQDRFQAEVIESFWERLSAGEVETEPFAEGLGEAMRTGHVTLYSRKPSEQQILSDLGAGDYYASQGSAVQMLFSNNYGRNKLDYFMRRDIATRVRLQPNGDAVVTTTARLANQAEDDAPPTVLGEENPGTMSLQLNLLMPVGAEVREVTIDGAERLPITYTDDEAPVVWDFVDIPSGEEVSVRIVYRVPGGVTGDRFELTLFPQTTLSPDTYKVRVSGADGTRLGDLTGLQITARGGARAEGMLTEPVRIGATLDR